MKSFALISLFFIAFIQSNNVLQYWDNGVDITCNITKIKVKDVSEKDRRIFAIKNNKQTWIFASLNLENQSDKVKIINLKNYCLSCQNRKSSETDIDSYIDYIIMDKKLLPKEKFTAKVYWVFDGELLKNDLDQIKLVKK